KGAGVTDKNQLAELNTLLSPDGSGIATADTAAASAGLTVADFCKTMQVCGEELPRVNGNADENANNSQPACADEAAGSVGILDVASGAKSSSSTCGPGTHAEAAGECAEPLAGTGLDSGTATEWMERLGSLANTQYCDPSVLTARSANASPQPSNSSHSSIDGDSSAVDWYAMFSQYLHSIS
ncbi:hypothetical protein H4R20_007148, partial [Coemansia guatemalensis]